MERKNVWVDAFGWFFLVASVFKTTLVGRYLSSPFLEHINYNWYPTLHQKFVITARVWIIPIVSATISPVFILIGMGIIFRQEWARILLIAMCGFQLLFAASSCAIASAFNSNWLAKNLTLVYLDESLWFLIIPALCIYVFTRPNVKNMFALHKEEEKK